MAESTTERRLPEPKATPRAFVVSEWYAHHRTPEDLPMRITSLIALATVAGVAVHPAEAQSRISIERDAGRSPEARVFRLDRNGDDEHRAALGVGTTSTGTLRDTLGVMITSITKGSPAEKAGLEEGNRIAAINGVSLRANAADIDDGELSGTLTRRLTRELSKIKPGDEVELRVYRDGRTTALKVKTTDSDSLFRRRDWVETSRDDRENRPMLGFGIGSSGSRRDTLGVLVMSVADSTPAARAGIEEGNRIAAINGVNLRVAREDAGDRWLGSTKAQRLMREIAALKPGENVTLKVYSNGQFRDVTLKVARAADLPKSMRSGMTFFGGGDDFGFAMPPMMPMPAMPAMPAMPYIAPMRPMAPMAPMGGVHFDYLPEVGDRLEGLRMRLDDIAPQLERLRPQLERARPQLNRLRDQLPDMIERVRIAPRLINVIV